VFNANFSSISAISWCYFLIGTVVYFCIYCFIIQTKSEKKKTAKDKALDNMMGEVSTGRRQTKQKTQHRKLIICVGNHYMQTNSNNVNKTNKVR
jgi:uncharacterized ion transporter superfamily protein YfcC